MRKYIVWLSSVVLAWSAAPGLSAQPLKGGTDSTMLQGGTESLTLQGGTEGTLIQGGTQGALIQGSATREGGPVTILFLVDASLSMKDKLGKEDQKMDAAKRVLQTAIARIPTDVNLGLRVFGQFAAPGLECQASALLVPPGQGNRRTIISKMRDIRPTGMTPLTYAIAQAAERDLARVVGRKTIILITDGEDTCGLDPCAYIQTLPSRGVSLKVDILGLDLKRDRSARAKLDCIAKTSGGKYYDADTAAQLIESVSHSVSQALSGTVLTPGVSSDVSKKIVNPETPPELVPIVPAGRLQDFSKLGPEEETTASPATQPATAPKKAPAKAKSAPVKKKKQSNK